KSANLSAYEKDMTISKLSRLERVLPEDVEVTIALTVIKNEHKAEVTIPVRGRILRAETIGDDFISTIDKAVDVLDGQISKLKGRLKNKSKKNPLFKEEFTDIFADFETFQEFEDESDIVIKRSKKFALKPMDAEEAAMNMELIGHTFFVFRNSQTDEINVIYKRKDGAYGLIEPEY
ncbi:MAG: ribosome-associated translation inhibitor RaiA, partial [Defluviitaleaceae bacterium]|nr:ribosome-associated translation inhibitor RaiA [Defluviitaleaceae bacterium]